MTAEGRHQQPLQSPGKLPTLAEKTRSFFPAQSNAPVLARAQPGPSRGHRLRFSGSLQMLAAGKTWRSPLAQRGPISWCKVKEGGSLAQGNSPSFPCTQGSSSAW